MKKEPKHVMIDLETLGKRPDAAIASIGAVLFDPRYGIKCADTFYMELAWKEQNRSIEKDTVKWWREQDPKARKCLKGKTSLEDAIDELEFFLPKDCRVWGNGAIFDIGKMEDIYYQLGLDMPWEFWNIRDCRTIKDMYECKRGGLAGNFVFTGQKHNALDDAKYQAEYVCKMWTNLVGDK